MSPPQLHLNSGLLHHQHYAHQIVPPLLLLQSGPHLQSPHHRPLRLVLLHPLHNERLHRQHVHPHTLPQRADAPHPPLPHPLPGLLPAPLPALPPLPNLPCDLQHLHRYLLQAPHPHGLNDHELRPPHSAPPLKHEQLRLV